MKFEKSDVGELPLNYAYCFDENGFYAGIMKRQPHPKLPGELLMPSNACLVKPVFVEGFKPRWDGQKWNLEAAGETVRVAESVSSKVLEKKRDEIFEQLRGNLGDVLRVEIQKRVDERNDLFLKSFKSVFQESSRTFLRMSAEEKAVFDDKFNGLVIGLESRVQEMMNMLEEKRSQIEQEVLKLQNEVLEMKRALAEIKEENLAERGFFQKVKDWFSGFGGPTLPPSSGVSV